MPCTTSLSLRLPPRILTILMLSTGNLPVVLEIACWQALVIRPPSKSSLPYYLEATVDFMHFKTSS